MQSGAFRDTILLYSVFRQRILTSYARPQARRVWIIFYSYLYTAMITIFFGEAGCFFFFFLGGGGGEASTPQIP